MKLGREEIQKLFLAGLIVLGVVYSYFSLLLGPLAAHQVATRKSVEALGPEIAAAQAQIKRTEDLEKAAPASMETMQQVIATIPEGSPVSWFPPRMGELFKKQGMEKSATRLNSEIVDKEMTGFRRLSWGIDIPKVEYVPFATAVAVLENEEPLLEINALQLDASREDAEMQHALITVSNIVKQ